MTKNTSPKKINAKDIFDVKKSAKALTGTPKKEKKERNIQKLAIQFINDPSEKNFGLLCERINWGLRSYIFKIVNDDEATTEVVTKTFENIYFKKDQFNPQIAQFSTWMYRIARNNALKYLQEQKAHSARVGVDFEDLVQDLMTNINSIDTESLLKQKPSFFKKLFHSQEKSFFL